MLPARPTSSHANPQTTSKAESGPRAGAARIENSPGPRQTPDMRILLLAISVLLCSACLAREPSVTLKGQRFSVELAETQEKQALGLMFRDSLPDDHGMLFIFPSEGLRRFWMKNTRIPLDIIYFDSDLKLVSVSEDVQPCRTQRCPSYPSEGPARYVLELNAGKAAELGLHAGDPLELHLD
jgi:uncharacterized membrane protein (UPF0127 family)